MEEPSESLSSCSPVRSIFGSSGYTDLMHRMVILPAAFFATLLFLGCWGHKQQFHTTVINNSSGALHSIEVDYPGGSYGIGELAAGASNQRWIFANGQCQYTIRFVDKQGKQYSPKAIDISKGPCPQGVTLSIDAAMTVTAAATAN